MDNNDRCFCELAPLYTLDLLDELDRAWVEQQAALSSELTDELRELQATVGVIPYSAAIAPLPIDLKERLFQRLNPAVSDRRIPDPLPLEQSTWMVSRPDRAEANRAETDRPQSNRFEVRPGDRRTRSRRRWLQAGGAIAALLVITLLVENDRLRQKNQKTQAVIAALQQPDTVIYPLRGTEQAANASGSVVVNPGQKTIVLLVQQLPELPSDRAYRLWVVPKGAAPTYCGQFTSKANGTLTQWAIPSAVLSSTSQLLVTAESAIAPPAPVGPLVMKSTI